MESNVFLPFSNPSILADFTMNLSLTLSEHSVYIHRKYLQYIHRLVTMPEDLIRLKRDFPIWSVPIGFESGLFRPDGRNTRDQLPRRRFREHKVLRNPSHFHVQFLFNGNRQEASPPVLQMDSEELLYSASQPQRLCRHRRSHHIRLNAAPTSVIALCSHSQIQRRSLSLILSLIPLILSLIPLILCLFLSLSLSLSNVPRFHKRLL